MKKVLSAALIFAASTTLAQASIIETFDTQADMLAAINLDVIGGDSGTEWRGAFDAGFDTPSVHLNGYLTPNSISLKDTSYEILSFEFSEWRAESSTGNLWTWSFYDASLSLLGTLDYTNDGDSTPQMMDLAAEGFDNVFAVRLEHFNGWMNIDNLEYDLTTAVPEPGTLAILGLGLAGMALRRRTAA